MNITFPLAENVVMTDVGLLKQCEYCHRYLPLEEFPKDDKKAFLRQDVCKDCVMELR